MTGYNTRLQSVPDLLLARWFAFEDGGMVHAFREEERRVPPVSCDEGKKAVRTKALLDLVHFDYNFNPVPPVVLHEYGKRHDRPNRNVLLDLGLISPEQLGSAIKLQQKKNERLGELLFQLKYISETDILKVLAERFRIHYITSEKLSNIRIPRMVLDMIPLEYAEAKHVLPILFDQERSVLSVLAAAPTDPKLLKEIQLLAQCQEVNAYLALKRPSSGHSQVLSERSPRLRADRTRQHGGIAVRVRERDQPQCHPVPEIQDQNPNLRLSDEVQAGSLMSQNLYIETLNILISLLEMRRGGAFRGHSASVARLAKRMAEEMDLPPDEIYFLVVAAYFHDLGKKDGVHPTLINLHTEKDLELAQKFYMAPVRLIEHIPFPRKCCKA